MKERPILFKQPHADEMVRAILDGRKTQFRVPVKPQPPSEIEYPPEGRDGWFCSAVLGAKDYGHGLEWTVGASWGSQPCPKRWLHLLPKLAPPLGTIGDRLWVRETFYWDEGSDKTVEQVAYKASVEMPSEVKAMGCRWTPSIHMPRWASRIDLEITSVRVERVQDITEEDAIKEGIEQVTFLGDRFWKLTTPIRRTEGGEIIGTLKAHEAFQNLWQSIYGTWDANPWVWVYEFRRVKP